MSENKLKGHLGLCRRAGKMSLGHVAAVTQCSFENRNVTFITADITSDEIYFYIGAKPKVFTVDDKGFADMLISDLTGGNE